MSLLAIIGIAVSLAMDAFAVSLANGFMIKELKFRYALRIAFSFGFFQALMPVIGWAAGREFAEYILAFEHWVAFGLLVLIGGKMIWESGVLNFIGSKKDPAAEGSCEDDAEGINKKTCLHFPTLLLLSISTSIDALAVGLSLSFLGVAIIKPILIIGAVTFIICLGGVYIGDTLGHLFEDKLELIGGLILIGIGTKILLEQQLYVVS